MVGAAGLAVKGTAGVLLSTAKYHFRRMRGSWMSEQTTTRVAPVTLRDIAERCQVSKSTVAQALRGQSRLAAATVARVLAVAKEMGYDPTFHEGARRLALRKHGREMVNHLVALFFPQSYLRVPFFLETFRGITDVLSASGFGVCVGHVREAMTDDSLLPFPQVMRRGDLDGVIAPGAALAGGLLDELRASAGFDTRPVVSLFDAVPTCGNVVADRPGGVRQAIRHLLELGHRHVMLVYYYLTEQGPEPLERYHAAAHEMQEWGIDPDTHLHLFPFIPEWVDPNSAHHDLTELDGAGDDDPTHPLVAYLADHRKVTAILAINDAFALHAWYTLHRAGYRVPDDISIVGFDDTDPMRDDHGANQLTTVRCPLETLGREAGRLMVARITGDSCEENVLLPTELVVRRSTAKPGR
jgi:DNA-binding LacI/PurR family transcriptional regulator